MKTLILLLLLLVAVPGCAKTARRSKVRAKASLRRTKTEAERMEDHEWNGIPY